MFKKSLLSFAVIASLSSLTACSSDDDNNDNNQLVVPSTYSYTSMGSSDSSVSYSGQVARHLLILELNNYIDTGLATDIENGVFTSSEEVYNKLLSFYKSDDDAYDLDLGERVLTTSTSPDRKQNTLKEISSSTKDLSGKIAGNDATGQHQDWSTDFVAFGAKGSQSPEQLILAMFNELADNAAVEIAGDVRKNVLDENITKVYITADGRDLKQLIQKILLGAVAYSQGTDDYLDNDIDGKGLNADNTELVDGKSYSNLEHQFDEGFGYFGAARDYLDYTIEEIAAKGGREDWQGMHDSNADGMIDFNAEYNFGHAQNAAKRDINTAGNSSPTSFAEDAMTAFLTARQIIANANVTELDAESRSALLEQRDIAVENWEKAIASTVVHYINDTLADYEMFGGDDFNYNDLAKHWSELKGFHVSLQFNPRAKLSKADFATINTYIGDKPVLNADEVSAYLDSLEMARDMLQSAYQFNAENVANW